MQIFQPIVPEIAAKVKSEVSMKKRMPDSLSALTEEMCEESFPLMIKMNCGQTCEIDFRHSLGAKCTRDANGNCVPLKFQKNIAQNKC